MSAQKITIAEITPRDGWQSVRDFIPTETKIELIERMIEAGIERIQAGSFVSPKAIPQMRDATEVFGSLTKKYPDVNIFALVPNLRGAENAVACGVKEVSVVISVSESHNKANINRTVAESFEGLKEIREAFPDITLNLDAATAFGCPFEGETPLPALLKYLEKAADVGVDSFDLCDTIGVAYPVQVERYIQEVRKNFSEIPLEVHIHDTRNMGIVNTWTAIKNGVTRVQTALGGLGGCPFAPGASGNTSTEDLVYMLHKNGFDTGINFDKLVDVARYMRTAVNGNYSGHQITIDSAQRCVSMPA
ncbi:hydroxymethylglutaryl-CoA lyase [Synergistales bacterium]|nr:hydroxymethylglutaryl-CoA lyase [Synergistales bacterium]